MNAPLSIRQNRFGPGRLWSLLDMQQFLGERLSIVWNSLAIIRSSLGSDKKLGDAELKTATSRNAIHLALSAMRIEFQNIGLPLCLDQVERIELSLGWNGKTFHGVPITIKPEQLGRMFDELSNRLTDALRGEYILSLSRNEAEFYEIVTPPFGIEVQTKFPSAIYDIEEASKCYALERSTASVFHSIRSLEAAIRALSRCLSIPDPTRAVDRNWGAMLKKLGAEIERRWPGSSTRLSGDGEFFDTAYAALAAMQNPWRNATMHLSQKYTPDEARHIMDVVKGFMKKLASRMDEDGMPLV